MFRSLVSLTVLNTAWVLLMVVDNMIVMLTINPPVLCVKVIISLFQLSSLILKDSVFDAAKIR